MIYCLTLKSGVHRLVDLPDEVMPHILRGFTTIPGRDAEGNLLPDDFGWLVIEPDTAINLNQVDAIQRHYPPDWFAAKASEGVWEVSGKGSQSEELARESYFYATVAIDAVKTHGLDVVKVAEAIAQASLEEPASGLPGGEDDDNEY